MTKAQLTELRETWRSRVTDFLASRQSGAAWCAAHQIKEHQLWYWKQKFSVEENSNHSSAHWLPVEIHEQAKGNESLLIRIGQATIEVNTGFDTELLRDVVNALTPLC